MRNDFRTGEEEGVGCGLGDLHSWRLFLRAKRVGVRQTMSRPARVWTNTRASLWASLLILAISPCAAQTAHHAKKPDPKPEPTQQELFQYIRGKLLSLTPNDGINDTLEVAFDPASSTLSITQPEGHCDIFLGAIDGDSLIWEVFDPDGSYHTRPQILRLTLTSLSGKAARTCYDKTNQIDTSLAANRVRLMFELSKSDAFPNFTDKMGKAITKLIEQCGGAPEKDPF